MRTHRRRLMAASTFVVLALLASACGDDDDSPSGAASDGGGEEAGTYTFGVNAELSGPIDGTWITKGVKAYAEEVNAKGGINGHKIEVIELDNAADQARAAANATQLTTADKVTAMFGHLLSANCTASAAIAERNTTPTACLSVAEPNPYVYNLGPSNATAGVAFVNAAKEVVDTDEPKIAFAYVGTLTNIALSKTMPDIVEEAGGTLTASEQIAFTATDMSPIAAALVSSEPDVILFTHLVPIALMKAIRTAGFDGPVIGLEGSAGLNLFPVDDPNLYVMSVYKFPDPASDDPAVQRYVSALEKVVSGLGSFASYSNGEIVPVYLTAAAFGDALERCGYPCPGTELKKELDRTKMDFGELVPTFEYKADDHYPYPNWFLYKVAPDSATLLATLPLKG